MNALETPLELAQRFVTETEVLVKDQITHISELARHDYPTAEAEKTLASLQELLGTLRENLARQQERFAKRPRGALSAPVVVQPHKPPEAA